MEVLMETTQWDNDTPNHMYIVDGMKCLGYIKRTDDPYPWPLDKDCATWFTQPIMFDKRYRKFLPVVDHPFETEYTGDLRKVVGSKGQVYLVDDDKGTCTCPGFQFRKQCKHVGK